MTQEAPFTQEVDLYSAIDPSTLPDDPVLLKQLFLQLLALLRKETKRREDVERNMDLLLRKLRASKSQTPDPGQMSLFDAVAADAASPPASPPEPEAQTEAPRKCRPHGRRKPPANLEEVEVLHDLPPQVKQELGLDNLLPLPDVVTYQYDYRASKLVVLRHVQKKYLRRDTEAGAPGRDSSEKTADSASASDAASDEDQPARNAQPASADEVTQAISKQELVQGTGGRILLGEKPAGLPDCEAAPGLLAFIWLSKFGDHLPLYRLESITQRYGITFARSTTCDWMLRLADTLRPLWECICREVRRSRVIHTDDTTVPMQDPETGQKSVARFWNYIGDEDFPLLALEFTTTHERAGPAGFLKDYRGYLQADAYNGYDGIYLDSDGRIIEVGCWQHARKRYKKAAESDVRASCGMAFIKSMYAVEKELREQSQAEWQELTRDERAARILEVRQSKTAPLLQSFRSWIDKTVGDALPKSELGDAFRYTLNQWDALNQFVNCGLLAIDNNVAERAHRGIAIGRKNWLHVGSERGGHAAAIHFSFIASCKMNGIDPFVYLVDILHRLAATPESEMVNLLPHRWKKPPVISVPG